MKSARLNLRARLTVVFGGTFLVAGLALIGVMYLLVRHRVEGTGRTVVRSIQSGPGGGSAPDPLPGAAGGSTGGPLVQVIDSVNAGTLTSLLEYSLLAVLLLTVAACAAGWLIAGRTLHPLQEITATARRIAASRVAGSNLHERLALTGPRDEIRELGDTFDAMLERLDQAFAGQRRFVANASHELRTPLAIDRTVIEVALGDPDASPDVRRLGATLLSTNRRSEQLIEGLLTLAGSEGDPAVSAPLDLADVVRQVAETTAAEAAAAGITVTTHLGEAPTAGDGVLLERLALNLVQNGLRHNTSPGRVEVVTGVRDGRAELMVSNSGPVVPPYEVEGLFEPFRRLGGRVGSREDGGSGLGLSIVRAVAVAHGGTVLAHAPGTGGLVVRVLLPVVTPAVTPSGPVGPDEGQREPFV